MKENELEELIEFVKQIIQGYLDDGITIRKSISSYLISTIREKYSIKKREYPETEFYLVETGENLPVCKGCFNEFGSCGTSCVGCEKIKAWDKEWELYMWIDNIFTVYKKKNTR